MTIIIAKLLRLSSFFLSIGTACCLLLTFYARAEEADNIKIYLGTYNNRIPYSFLNKAQQPKGVLVERTLALCRSAKMDCEFSIGKFERLLTDVQTFQLNGFIVIDTLILPDIDQLKLTLPICKLNPVFIQKKTASPRSKPDDFKSATIGVLQDSLMHLHLVENYASNAKLKPYLVLESGIIDLVTGRIDALAADAAFFQARVANTILGKRDGANQLVAAKVSDAKLPASSMAIAMRARDKALVEKLDKALQETGELKDCSALLQDIH